MAAFEQTMRWFGPTDPVTLSQIRQAGATGVVTALHHLPPGAEWTDGEIQNRKAEIEAAGMRWSVVESVPVHEEIKRQTGAWEHWLDNYGKSLRTLGRNGIDTVCYNFMAVTDWTRTQLTMPTATGALALRFDRTELACFDLHILKRPGADRDHPDDVCTRAEELFASMKPEEVQRLTRTILLGLPGTVEDLTLDEFRARLAWYEGWTSDRLRESLFAFLGAVVPIAEEAGVKLAIHPDDPPFPMFGLPRVACTESDLQALTDAVPSPSNGITFCTGSLGARADNDLVGILNRLGDRIHFLHLRNVLREADGSFFEDDHLQGSTDMAAVVRAAIELSDRTGRSLPMRPDHGHVIEGDDRFDRSYPGYSFVGRLRGLAELRGLELGLRSRTCR